ncbi:MAG: hypothetical protein GXP46_00985 [Deferribacteres bacterium]|nr:hypothetical protein [Deferribacteres bacterium]
MYKRYRLPVLFLLVLAMSMILNIPMAAGAVDDGLIAYYPFDGNALDASGNGNDGTEYGGLKYKQGIKGESASLDGIDDYIRVPSDLSLNPVDQLSISFWVKVEGFTNVWSPIIHKGGPISGGSANREYTVWLQDTSSFLLSSAGDNSSQYYNYACCAVSGYWTHYAGIIDRQNHSMKIYVNGVLKLDANDPYSTFNNNSDDLLIGWTEEVYSGFSPFKGRIDELRIYHRALTEDEVKELYEEFPTPPVIDLWQQFPDNQGDNGFYAYGYAAATNTYWLLEDAGSYIFYRPQEYNWGNPKVYRKGGPWISLNPSGNYSNSGYPEDAVLAYVVPQTAYYQLNGAFWDAPGSWNGIDVYIKKDNIILWSSHLNSNVYKYFNLAQTLFNAGDIIYFGVNAHNYGWFSEANDWGKLLGQMVIEPYYTDQLGNTIKTQADYSFILEETAQGEFSIQLTNQSDDTQSVTLEVINPHPELTVSTTQQNPVTLARGDVQDIPIFINTGSMPVGVYDDLLLKLTAENGETLYSNIKVTVVEKDAAELPDLSIDSQDIDLYDYTLSESATLKAVIHNKGQSPASNVQVQFYEFGSLLGEIVLDDVPAEGIGTASITAPITTSGEHLIRVVVDSSNTINELDENNNEASQMIRMGSPAPVPGSILITGSLPSKVYTNELFTISGRAVYDVYVNGVRYTNYVVKGGSVQITIKDDAGNEWVYGGIHTNTKGNFARTVQAPAATGTYQISMTVTDETLSGKRDLLFSVRERPLQPPQPPPPPPRYGGHGSWTYVPASPASPGPGKWNWVWTKPPVNAPVSQSDLRVFSENIHFSRFNPEAGEEITIFAEIRYWATSTDLVALNVPVNFYVTYPGTPKMKIGETVIDRLSVGAPDFGSRYVYATWKNRDKGLYIVEVQIDPSYQEENNLNNAATRAIIVGRLQSQQGAISGQVTDPWGGVANIVIELYDSGGTTLLQNRLTDDTGNYLFENLPVDDYQVHIVKPEDYRVDAKTKAATVTDGGVTEVDFLLSRQEPPVADAGGPYSGSVGEPVMLDAGNSHDPDGQIVTYRWDCDNDGIYELTTSSPALEHTWNYEYDGVINLMVTDNDGLSATDTATVEIKVSAQELCGDLDNDGDVDGDDRNILRLSLNTRAGDAGFIPEADYDGDGLISYNDYREWYVCYNAFIAP